MSSATKSRDEFTHPTLTAPPSVPPHKGEGRFRLSRYAASLVNCAASVESLKAVVDDAPPEMVMATWSK